MAICNKALIISGMITTLVYVGLAQLVKDSEYIWFLTRGLGLAAYIALCLTVILGELRMLTKMRVGGFGFFRFHTPLGIITVFLVLLHFVSAASDNFKWGAGLVFSQFLGFSFSDMWLALLSLGTIAAYLIAIVALTSATRSIQFLGFKNWKLVHYLSYLAFAIVFVHSILLGTDVKTSWLAFLVKPIMVWSFIFATALFLTRVILGVIGFDDQRELYMAIGLFLLLLFGGYFIWGMMDSITETNSALVETAAEARMAEAQDQAWNDQMILRNKNLSKALAGGAENG